MYRKNLIEKHTAPLLHETSSKFFFVVVTGMATAVTVTGLTYDPER
jgi:hypothetical protein